jgi:ubiquinone/menaquinone biosynthesis C-methylase UbiE
VGLDPDPRALARARRKAARSGAAIRFDEGFADALPYPDASFDRAVSSFVFHHLDNEGKRGALAETLRVLRPGGAFALLDFGGAAERPDGLLTRLFHHDEALRDNYGGRLAALLREAGFRDARAAAERRTWFGHVACYTAAAAGG